MSVRPTARLALPPPAWSQSALLLAATALASSLVLADAPAAIRAPVVLLFVCVVPGAALVRPLELESPAAAGGLAIGLSLALTGTIAGVLLYVHVWSPTAVILAVGAATVAIILREIGRSALDVRTGRGSAGELWLVDDAGTARSGEGVGVTMLTDTAHVRLGRRLRGARQAGSGRGWRPGLALEAIDRLRALGHAPGIVTCRQRYGTASSFRAGLDERGLRYLVEVDTGAAFGVLFAGEDSRRRCSTSAAKRSAIGAYVRGRQVALEPFASSRFAVVGGERLLLLEWPETEEEPSRFWLSNLPGETPVRRLAALATRSSRHRHARPAPRTAETTIVISDLHLCPPPAELEPCGGEPPVDASLVSFVALLTRRAREEGGEWRLVILGDLLELLGADAGSAVDALEAIASTHSDAFAAMAAAADAGVSIEIVPGNHDSELLDARLQRRFRDIVGAHAATTAAPARVRFHSWFFLLPGVVYADHGSQYHPINAVPNPLAPHGRWSAAAPLGARLDAHLGELRARRMRRKRPGAPAVLADTPAHARFAVSSLRRLGREATAAGRAAAAADLADALSARAQEAGLTTETLVALNALSCGSPRRVLGSLLSAAAGATSRVTTLQQRAATAIHRLLLAEEAAAAVYVFGHTHTPASAVLDVDGGAVRWLNSGAWSNPGAHTFVEIARTAEGVSAELRDWDEVAAAESTSTPCKRELQAIEEGSR